MGAKLPNFPKTRLVAVAVFLLSNLPFSLLYTNSFTYSKTIVSTYCQTMRNLSSRLGYRREFPSNVKVLAFDDASVSYFDSRELSLDQWGELIRYISSHGAKTILIDSSFYLPRKENEDVEGLARFVKALDQVDAEVFANAISVEEIQDRGPGLAPTYRTKKISVEGPLASEDSRRIYGGNEVLLRSLDGFGVDSTSEALGTRLYQMVNGKVALNLAMLSAKTIEISGQTIRLDQGPILETTRLAEVIPIYYPKEHLLSNFASIRDVFVSKASGKMHDSLRGAEVVLILPSQFTSGTKEISTVVGSIPRGHHLASLVGNVKSGTHFKYFDHYWLMYLCTIGILALIVRLPITHQIIVLVATNILLFLVPAFLFGGYFFVNVLGLRFHFTTVAIASIFFAAIISLRAKMKQDRQLAAISALQNIVSPPHHVAYTGTEVWSRCLPADKISGDFCLHREADGNFYLFLGDVSGHGIPQGFCATLVIGYLSSMIATRQPLLAGLKDLNRAFCNFYRGQLHITMFALRFDTRRGVLSYVNAGHRPAFFHQVESASVKFMTSSGSPIGFIDDDGWKEESVDISETSVLLVTSDGIYENPNNEDRRVTHRSIAENMACGDYDEPKNLELLLKQLYDNRELEDDVSIAHITLSPKKAG